MDFCKRGRGTFGWRWFAERCRARVFFSLLGVLVAPAIAVGQDTPDFFRQNCMNCHTIGGGDLTGPDLKDVLKRKDRPWLTKFMMNPKSVLDSGDPYATKLLASYKNVPMPTLPGMTKERCENLLDLIEAESKLEKSQFFGLQISNKPFTDVDRKLGREIFLGLERLEKNGTACISCHSMHDLPALGGGQLGPDLTRIYGRLEGRRALSAWLVAPGTETMQPIFKNHPLSADEIHALVAYFEVSASETPSEPSVSRVAFLLMGLAGAAVMVFAMDAIWKRRFYAVRRPIVEETSTREKNR